MTATETVTITEACRRFGISPHILRGWIHAKKIPATLDTSMHPPRYRLAIADLPRVQRRYRPWVSEEDEFLTNHIGIWSRTAIARRLGRTEVAIKHRLTDLGTNVRIGAGHYTASQVALILGLTREGVLDRIRRGEITTLAHHPSWGRVRCHLITEAAIKRFIRERILGPPYVGRGKRLWSWRRIEPGYFRNYAARLAAGKEP